MNFIMRDYHTDHDRKFYLSSAGWNRSAYTTDAFRYAFENFVNVAASESELRMLSLDFSDFTDESIAITHNSDGSVTYTTNIDWNKIHWFNNMPFEKEIEAADSDKIDEFLSQ